ncbi:hypothetical protein D3C85_1542880 [compost metagenome]
MLPSIRGNRIPHMRRFFLISEQGRQIPCGQAIGDPGIELKCPLLRLVILLQQPQIMNKPSAPDQQNPLIPQRSQHLADLVLLLRGTQGIDR